MVRHFLKICKNINCPVSVEKTEWADTTIVFLGLLLEGKSRCIMVPQDKKIKALNLVDIVCEKRTITIKQLQLLTGTLNFLCKAIIPGRAFTKLMYNKLKLVDKQGNKLKQYHHVMLNHQFKEDCRNWKLLLHNAHNSLISRPFIDIDLVSNSEILDFYTDSSGNPDLGFGCVFGTNYTWYQWESAFIKKYKPSIQYLELYALCIGLMTWRNHPKLNNSRIIIFCDNQAVCDMWNDNASNCINCMHLIRILVLNNILTNRRVSVKYVESAKNSRADVLSRLDFQSFFRLSLESRNKDPSPLPKELWPMSKIWQHT